MHQSSVATYAADAVTSPLDLDAFTTIGIERTDGLLTISIDRKDSSINAVDATLHAELTALFPALQREREARAVVLTGRGTAFSAGGDFGWFPELQAPGELEMVRLDAKQMIWDLLDVHLPIVCAVNGHARGLGASLALLCDVIFMAESATVADPHVRVGLVAGDGGTVAWPMAVGPALAKQYLLTGDAIGAEEAVRIGLVNAAFPDDDLLAEATAFAMRLAAGAPLAVQYTKLAVNKLVKDALNTAFDVATALEIVTFHSDDHREALDAFREKRQPEFKGR
jgi:enoyl-CoA hydratase